MDSYKIEWRHTARKELRNLPRQDVGRIVEAVGHLATQPRPYGAEKLQGSENSYRIRVGDYRVIYEVQDEVRIVLIQRVRHRKDAYRA